MMPLKHPDAMTTLVMPKITLFSMCSLRKLPALSPGQLSQDPLLAQNSLVSLSVQTQLSFAKTCIIHVQTIVQRKESASITNVNVHQDISELIVQQFQTVKTIVMAKEIVILDPANVILVLLEKPVKSHLKQFVQIYVQERVYAKTINAFVEMVTKEQIVLKRRNVLQPIVMETVIVH